MYDLENKKDFSSQLHFFKIQLIKSLAQSVPWSDSNEEYSTFPKAPAWLEPHHQIV